MPGDPLYELLTGLARDDARALIEETRAAGRADAAAVLRELWRDAYLAAATTGPPADGDALWVYGVVAAEDAERLPAGLRGVDPAGEVRTVARGRLAALVSPVPLAEFGDEQLRAHLEDLAWVERVARAHEQVLQAAMAVAPVVPLRLCTICLDADRVAGLIDEGFEAALTQLRGRSEWGVKVFATTPDAEAAPADDPAAYIERKRRAKERREQGHREAVACAEDVHEAVSALAVAAVANTPQHREAHGRDADMVLNGAYLVADDRREELHALVERLAAEHDSFAVELTGPWPAYNFAGVLTG